MMKIVNWAACLMMGTFVFAQNTQVVSNSGGYIENGVISLDQTIGELAVDDLKGADLTLEQGFHNTFLKMGLVVNAMAFLQGPYNETNFLMNDNLRSLGLIPLNSPYLDSDTATTQDILDVVGNDAIVDWVFVEIRDRSVNNLVIGYQSALIQRDGDVVDVDGINPLEFDLLPGTYFVSVSHRNHLGALTENAEMLTKNPEVLDFTDSAFTTFGNYARVELTSGDMALWAGDVNGNGQVRFQGPGNDTNKIKDNVLDLTNGNPVGSNFYPYVAYDNADIDMNGQVRYLGPGNDTNTLKDIVLSHPANSTSSNFFPFFVQIPN
ncbi:hypothetical protein A9Q87_10210 [Flavobacteriales bacterium 34_180_T64]|nr:hypothetical protein A9Q87_10210 [Flavobacteriales bacterium 34_180_T64]